MREFTILALLDQNRRRARWFRNSRSASCPQVSAFAVADARLGEEVGARPPALIRPLASQRPGFSRGSACLRARASGSRASACARAHCSRAVRMCAWSVAGTRGASLPRARGQVGIMVHFKPGQHTAPAAMVEAVKQREAIAKCGTGLHTTRAQRSRGPVRMCACATQAWACR